MTESVFGPTIVVEGDVTGGDLVVHGTIRGAIADASAVTIAKGARVEATIAARSVFVAGAVEGVITARERIELTADAVMTGDV
ncbi:polymer-forming cytoskeletal protein, partial [Myxococcota bacterium]|nr:polymer-forming cytoskeletal protein [Myxococcota bacterium]